MTEEPIARWSGGICKTCGNYTHSCKCNHPKSPLLDELFSTKTAPTPCPTCGGLRERHLERQLSLAQTEIKEHMRVVDDLKARIAELEKVLASVPAATANPSATWDKLNQWHLDRAALKDRA